MKTVGDATIGFFFTVFLIIFLLLTTVYFQLLNSSFLFATFDKFEIYQKIPQLLAQSLPNDPNLSEEEQREYAKIAGQISPDLVKQAIEPNLLTMLNYLHGKRDDLVIIFPALIPEMGEIKWTPEQSPAATAQSIAKFHGAANKVLMLWFVVLAILIGIFWINKKPATLLTSGGLIIFFSLVLLVGCWFLSHTLTDGIEPSQKLLGLLSVSLMPVIFAGWLVIGIVVLALGIAVKKIKK